jgi:hypothetical protein
MKSVSMVSRNPGMNGARKPVAAAAVALFALGVIGATVLDRPDNGDNPPSAAGRGPGEGNGGESPTVDQDLDVRSPAVQAGATRNTSDFTTGESTTGQRGGGGAGGAGGSGTGSGNSPPAPGSPDGGGNPQPNPPGSPPPEDTSVLGLQLIAPGLTTSASAEVGGDCTGLELLGLTTLGCPGPPAEGLLTIRTSGILGENEIGL